MAAVTGPDLSDDGEGGFGYGLGDDVKLGRVSPVATRADGTKAGTGKIEIMVHRTFETMTIETPSEATRDEKNGDVFPGYK